MGHQHSLTGTTGAVVHAEGSELAKNASWKTRSRRASFLVKLRDKVPLMIEVKQQVEAIC